MLRLDFLRAENVLASKAFVGVGWCEIRGNGDALIKHETIALVMRLLTLLKVLENATLQLIDLLETKPFHVRTDLLAPDAACAEHDHRILFHLFR